MAEIKLTPEESAIITGHLSTHSAGRYVKEMLQENIDVLESEISAIHAKLGHATDLLAASSKELLAATAMADRGLEALNVAIRAAVLRFDTEASPSDYGVVFDQSGIVVALTSDPA